MEEEFSRELRGFDAVWQRVQGKEQPVMAPAPQVLAELLRLEAAGAAEYSALCRLSRGRGEDALRRMAAQCRENLRQLRALWFLESGSTALPEPPALPADGFLGYLRRAYLRESAAGAQYLAAAAGDREHAELFSGLAKACAQRREKLASIAVSALE